MNFVGKLIGPGGATMKRLQHDLGVRIAVYGRGSMRDKKKVRDIAPFDFVILKCNTIL